MAAKRTKRPLKRRTPSRVKKRTTRKKGGARAHHHPELVGLGMVRYVLELEPLASADHPTVVAAIAPTMQRYLTGSLG